MANYFMDETNLKEKNNQKIKEPKKYAVVMYNDDFTPMDFVVELLVGVFQKSREKAVDLMLTVHHEQQAVVGIYNYDIACSKTTVAMEMAKSAGYPFLVSVKEA